MRPQHGPTAEEMAEGSIRIENVLVGEVIDHGSLIHVQIGHPDVARVRVSPEAAAWFRKRQNKRVTLDVFPYKWEVSAVNGPAKSSGTIYYFVHGEVTDGSTTPDNRARDRAGT